MKTPQEDLDIIIKKFDKIHAVVGNKMTCDYSEKERMLLNEADELLYDFITTISKGYSNLI